MTGRGRAGPGKNKALQLQLILPPRLFSAFAATRLLVEGLLRPSKRELNS